MSEVNYAYSLNGEEYYGKFASREAAIAEAEEVCGHDGYGQRVVWTGRIVEASFFLRGGYTAYSLAENIIERADESLIDEIAADDCIISATDEQKAELGRLIVEWICTHCEFHRWGVKDVQEHEIEVTEE